MHFTLLVISDMQKVGMRGNKQLDKIMKPFQVDENGGKWDWYVVGGRFYSSIHASGGKQVRMIADDEKWYVHEEIRRRNSGFDLALVSDMTSIDPEWWCSVLLPDGTWHDKESYVQDESAEYGFRCERNPEWDRFEEMFIEPYRDGVHTAMVVDYHI